MKNLKDLSPSDRERFEERAAIMQFDAKMSREEAERRAFEEIRNRKAARHGS